MGKELYLGLDLSINNTGVCLVDSEGKYVWAVTIHPDKGISESIRKAISVKNNLVKELRCFLKKTYGDRFSLDNIRLVLIESCFIGASSKVGMNLSELHGIIKEWVLLQDLEAATISPQSLKYFVIDKKMDSKIKKNLIMKEIYKKYDVDLSDDNQADAFVLARMAYEFTTNNILKSKEKYYNNLKVF
jgi:Holliday junction resolvasome RuvABC endonuclease subunit